MGDMFEYTDARLQDEKNRQNSIETDDEEIQLEWYRLQRRITFFAEKEYKAAIKLGIAKELARKVLPEGLTKTRIYMNGTLRSWVHYIDLRSANGTQKEHMDIALGAKEIFIEQFPSVAEAMEWI